MTIAALMTELKAFRAPDVFNPWLDYDKEYDENSAAPVIRAQHLERYLGLRVPQARFILIAEALGYQGGHFSGIAMTSERILLGNHPKVKPELVLDQTDIQRTSNCLNFNLTSTQRDKGFNEPTATIVWGTMMERKVSSFDVILWNIFPFHPYHSAKGLLSNRGPKAEELVVGVEYAKKLMGLCPKAAVIAIGKHAARTLDHFGIGNRSVPHPSMGGATDFKQAMNTIWHE